MTEEQHSENITLKKIQTEKRRAETSEDNTTISIVGNLWEVKELVCESWGN